MYCPKCGTQLPDDASFCIKCGTSLTTAQPQQAPASTAPILAPLEAKSLNCPHCGAPITPKFGEMIITCEYCGTGVSLGNDGWRGVQRQTMLPLKLAEKDQVAAEIHSLMDKGLLHRHLQEKSTLEEMNLSFVPYWIVSVSARTSVVASDMAVQAGEIATTAALAGVIGSGFGGRRGGGGFAGPLLAGALMGGMMGPSQAAARKTYQMNNNYNFPIVALKALTEHQPRNYQFNLDDRTLFDVSKVPKGIKILNGDVGEEAAKYQAKTLVDQLQSERAHEQYHMIQQLHTDIDVADSELLYAPIWFARYEHKGNKIALVIDGNSASVINSIGL
ncbi:MAG: zinc-ribbon domain-containing protein [Candidatus Bathyarchaeia archaeon]